MAKLRTCVVCEATSAGTAVHFSTRRPVCDWCVDELGRRGLIPCSKCGTPAPASDFPPKSKTRQCPACRSAARKAYYANHREQERESNRTWRNTHRDLVLAKNRRFYKNNRDRLLAKRRADYARNPEHHLAITRRDYWKHHDRRLATRRAYHQANRERNIARGRRWRLRRHLAILRGRMD